MVTTLVILGLAGLSMGSFIDAFTWRLRTKRNFITGRSECEKCHHVLAAMDLIPVISWVLLKGRCRYCQVKLSPVAPFTELLLGVLFVVSFLVWPYGLETWQGIASFALWLVYLVMLGALFVYDLRWMILPDSIVIPLIFSAFIFAGLRVGATTAGDALSYAYIAVDALALTMVYWLLHTASQGRWVGYGDVKLSIFIGLLLGWPKALLAFGLANVIGFLVVLPGILTGRLDRKSQMPFGPFLIIGTVLAGLWGEPLIRWYLAMLGHSVGP